MYHDNHNMMLDKSAVQDVYGNHHQVRHYLTKQDSPTFPETLFHRFLWDKQINIQKFTVHAKFKYFLHR